MALSSRNFCGVGFGALLRITFNFLTVGVHSDTPLGTLPVNIVADI